MATSCPKRREPSSAFAVILALAVATVGGCTSSADDGDPTSDAGTNPESTTGSGGPQGESGRATMGDESGSSSGGALEVCGDGVMQGEESCDDGNTVDGDGCSEGCVAEGKPIWTWDAAGERIADVAVASNGSVFVAATGVETASGRIVELSADGEELDTFVTPFTVGGDSVTTEFRISSLVTVGTDVVYTSETRELDAGGELLTVRRTVQRLGPDGWLLEDEGLLLRHGVAAGDNGRLVSFRGNDVLEYGAGGSVLWMAEISGVNGVEVRSGGGAFAFDGSRILALDAEGGFVWGIDESDEPTTGFFAVREGPNGTIFAMQQVGEEDDATGRLWSVDAEGAVVSTEDLASPAAAFAIDPDGNLFLPVDGDTTLTKFGPDSESLWSEFQGGAPILDVEVHPDGAAVIALQDGTVSKLAQ